MCIKFTKKKSNKNTNINNNNLIIKLKIYTSINIINMK